MQCGQNETEHKTNVPIPFEQNSKLRRQSKTKTKQSTAKAKQSRTCLRRAGRSTFIRKIFVTVAAFAAAVVAVTVAVVIAFYFAVLCTVVSYLLQHQTYFLCRYSSNSFGRTASAGRSIGRFNFVCVQYAAHEQHSFTLMMLRIKHTANVLLNIFSPTHVSSMHGHVSVSSFGFISCLFDHHRKYEQSSSE